MEIFREILMFEVVCALTVVTTEAAAYSGPITTNGINLIKSYESFQANFYTDPVGIETIGYGYTCSTNPCDTIKPPITEVQATTLMKTQLKSFENCVNQNVKYANLNAAQFSALVSFSFNVGYYGFENSALVGKLNRNDVSGAASEFAKWNKGGGKVALPGLTKRREAERQMFCSNNIC